MPPAAPLQIADRRLRPAIAECDVRNGGGIDLQNWSALILHLAMFERRHADSGGRSQSSLIAGWLRL
jgi:hypothetical protein